MTTRLLIITLLSTLLFATPANAGPASDALGVCLIDSLNGKERKTLAKWIFLGMAAHPDMSKLADVPPELQLETDIFIGELLTRLLTEDCIAETKEAFSTESTLAFATAFELVGKVAMQELMTNTDVSTALTGYNEFVDLHKLGDLE